MSGLENRQDRIDEYIRGTMSDKEKTIFEDELMLDAELKREFEVQRAIADAVQSVQLKRLLQGTESGLSNSRRAFVDRWHWMLGVAAAFIVIFFSWSLLRQTQRIRKVGEECYAAVVVPISRGGNAVDSLLSLTYSLMGTGQYKDAEAVLSEMGTLIRDGLNEPVVGDESHYVRALLELKQYEGEWYRVILAMQQGKFRQAKFQLMEIAHSNSPYADNAKTILETIFNLK